MTTTRSRWATLAVLAALTLAGCGGGEKGKATAEGEVDPATTEVRVKPVKSMAELAEALEISVPEGYILQPDEVGDTGPSDLEKAIRDDGEDDARDVLTRTRFVRGYQRMWSLSEDDEIIAYVYQFADHAGAVEYTNRVTADAAVPMPGVTIEKFTLRSLDGATGVNGSGSDPAFGTSSVTFVKGPYSVQVVVNGSSLTGLQSLVTALAEDQYSRL